MGKIKKNIAYNMIYQVLILIVPLITTPYVSRVLLPEGIGLYSITTTITKYFWLFALLGMAKYGNRCIAKVKDNKEKMSVTFWNLFYFQLIVSVIVFIVYTIFICCFAYDRYGMIIICQLPYVLSAIFEISWFFYGIEQFKFLVTRNVIVKVLTAITIFVCVNEKNDVWIYVIINALNMLVSQLCMWPFLRKNITFKKPDINIIKKHFKPNCTLFISVVAVSIYTLMDKIMIEYYSDTVQLGYYENSHKIMDVCCNLIGAIGTVMLPRITFLMEKNENDVVDKYFEKSLKYIMIFAIAISFGMAAVSKEFSIVYFGEKFVDSGIIMAIMAISIIFYSWGSVIRTQYLIPAGRDDIFVKGTVWASIINVIFNMILIKKYGAIGAAISTVGAVFVESLYETIKIKNEIKFKKYFLQLMPIIAFGMIMFAVCRVIPVFIDSLYWSLILQIAVGGIVFSILSFIHLIKSKDIIAQGIFNKLIILMKNKNA